MSYTKYTGKSASSAVTFNSVTITGWRKITIDEKGRPLPTPMDVTAAGDSAYTFVDDPLGGKTSANASVTIEGFLSKADKSDGATGILQFAPGATYTLKVTPKSGLVYTLTSAVLKTLVTGAEVAGIVPYTLTFQNSTSSGAWAGS